MRHSLRLGGMVLGLLLLASVVHAKDKKADEEKPAEKVVQLAAISIRGGLAETPAQPGIFGELQSSLRQTIQRLEKAAGDDSISGVVLQLDGLDLGRARVAELRAAIARTRKAGKKVYAQLDSGMASDYLLAAACDEIVMPPSGTLMLPGVRAEITFYKGLLDKLGVEADFLHVGAFKGAAEPLTRESLSDEVRQNMTAVIDDYYAQMVDTIAKNRGIKPRKVKKLIDQGLFTAVEAHEAGLIDRLAYRDQLEASLCDQHQAKEIKLVKGYGKKKIDDDFSGPLGMMKLLQAMMGMPPGEKKSTGKKIAVVYAVGAITTGKSEVGMFGGEAVGSDTIVAALKKAQEDKNVAAIVLRVDSPGGSALASDLIWRQVVQSDKPIIASMGDTAASGGYYISMGADKIFASPGTLTGSIGVVGGKLALRGLMEKAGVTTEVISRGKNSGLLSDANRFTKAERSAMQAMMEETYRQFTQKAAEGRKMDAEKLEKLAGGQVWTGRMAQENGLVDELGTLEDAIAAAKSAAGIDAKEKVELLELPKPASFFESLFGGEDDEAEVALKPRIDTALPELAPHLRQVETLRAMFRNGAALVLPFQVKIR